MTVYKLLAEIVDALRTSHQEHEAIRAEMATKEDLAGATASIRAEMATKDDLAGAMASIRAEMATKDDLAGAMASIRAEMATKEDLAGAMASIRAEMATKEDLAAAMASIRAEMATKEELTKVAQAVTKLGLDFEAFRHDTKVTLEMISELMVRTGRHEKAIAGLDRRTRRIENRLGLEPLPEGLDE